MTKLLSTIILSFVGTIAFAQSDTQPAKEFYNLDCEKIRPGQNFPSRWNDFLPSTKQYIARVDTVEKHSGKYSLFLTPKPGKKTIDSGIIAFPLPQKFTANAITLKGWLKLQDVQNHAGIMIRINDIQGNTIAVADLSEQKISGTRDWEQYTLKVPLPDKAAMIYIGPVLAGAGKLWADDFEIFFDGIDIHYAPLKPGYSIKTTPSDNYGVNAKAGAHIKLKNADIYYEIYGKGTPLLLLHGNSQSIGDFKNQIPDLAKKYKVIAVDTRGQGQSTDQSIGPLTYDQFADDMKQLLDNLHINKANILGWSDGGNTGLIMAIKYPEYINKLAVTGAVLNSSADAIDSKVLEEIRQRLEVLKGQTDNYSVEQQRLNQLMLDEPHISLESLKTIKAPTLVMAGDHDLVKDHHTRSIAANILGSKLIIFKNATHYVPRDDSPAFNKAVIDFFK